MFPLDLGCSPRLGVSPRFPGLPLAWVWGLTLATLALRRGHAWGCQPRNCILIRAVETQGVSTLTRLTAGTRPAPIAGSSSSSSPPSLDASAVHGDIAFRH